ncbi:serine/threonine-protein kinase [Dictyobacter arantiisoli]|uniref:Protein kinase domain-containing protein n=1 Tax=Dictyobacter arantiisoli TaxID=2014874 RepID=A0A5A5TFM6_9CHLR|nr:serine/threonine-protein kinase [Dictyobacter arantiisoli]GCF10015.1 hypothetical protein KDI_35790 [Dictyobacter arantiisoli]
MTNYVGQQFGSYRLLRIIGQGGFADVYLGEHVHLGSFAAVKILYARLIDEYHEHFLNEARTLARLSHHHIIRLLDFGIEDRIPFLIMEYAPHGTLRQRHPSPLPLPLSTVVEYVNQIAAGLQSAHDQNLIHRDLKPSNVLISQHNELLLSDFGVALIAQTTYSQSLEGVVAGTVAYVAPEQLQGKPQLASDQYALGIMVYEWLCGERPFHGTVIELWAQHQSATPAPLRQYVLDLPAEVEQVVLTALAKDPKQRFASVRAFATALEAASRPEAIAVLPAKIGPSTEVHAADQEVVQAPVTVRERAPQPADITEPDGSAQSSEVSLETTTEGSSAIQPALMTAPTQNGRKKSMTVALLAVTLLLLLASTLVVYGLERGSSVSPLISTVHKNQAGNESKIVNQGTHSPTVTPTVQAQATANAQIIATAQAQGKPQLLWTFATGSLVRSSPAVVNGSVYVGSDNGNLFAISSVTGQQEWIFATRSQINSRPTVVNGVVYVGSGDNNLYALDAMTGQEKWAFPTGSGISASPMVVNGTVYISSGSGKLYAVDTTTGQQKWFFTAGGPFWGSLIVANGVVYAGSLDHRFYALDAATGREKWAFTTEGYSAVSPAIANGVVYVGALDSRIYAIDATTGQQKWVFVTGDAIWSAPTVVNGVVYVGSNDHKLYALDAATGQQRWAFPAGDKVWSAPTVVNGVVYVGSMDHKLYAINTTTGQQKWAFLTGDAIQFSSPIVVNGVLYIGSNDHKLYAIAIG